MQSSCWELLPPVSFSVLDWFLLRDGGVSFLGVVGWRLYAEACGVQEYRPSPIPVLLYWMDCGTVRDDSFCGGCLCSRCGLWAWICESVFLQIFTSTFESILLHSSPWLHIMVRRSSVSLPVYLSGQPLMVPMQVLVAGFV